MPVKSDTEADDATAAPIGGGSVHGDLRRERRRQAREDDILEAARELMAARGLDAMTMDELAERAGVSKPTLYQYFPSKEAVAVQTVVRMVKRIGVCMDAVDVRLPAIARLERVVRRVLELRFAPDHPMLGLSAGPLKAMVRTNPEYITHQKRLVETLTLWMDEAQAAGDVAPLLSSRALVQMVFSLLRDTDFEEIVAGDARRADEVAFTLSTTFINGIRPR